MWREELTEKIKGKIYRPKILYPYSVNEIRKKIIFIHIPKNAGTSLSVAINGVSKPRVHCPWQVYQNKFPTLFKRSFKFCIIRNPIDRFRSALNYAIAGGNMRIRDRKLSLFIQDCNSKGNLFEFETLRYLADNYNIFRPQVYFVCDEVDRVIVDKMYDFANLQDLAEDLISYGIFFKSKEIVNKSKNEVNLLSIQEEIVLEVYKKDMLLWNAVKTGKT